MRARGSSEGDQVKSLVFKEEVRGARTAVLGRWGLLTKRVQVVLDIVVLSGAFVAAYLFRFDFILPASELGRLKWQLPAIVLLQILCQWGWGIYRFVWRYIGLAEVRAFIGAALTCLCVLFVVRFGLPAMTVDFRVYGSIAFIDVGLAFTGTLGIRVFRRMIYESGERGGDANAKAKGSGKTKVLLVGAGKAGVMVAREIRGGALPQVDVRAFVDDDMEKVGSVINGLKVIGTTSEIAGLVATEGFDEIFITIARASRGDLRRIVQVCESTGIPTRIIPGLYEILGGHVHVSQVRPVEIDDLLGREPVTLELGELRSLLCGKTVVVTGAGGSIGSELVRQVSRFSPLGIILVERSEFALYQIEEEMRRTRPELTLIPAMADVCDERRIRDLFRAYRPGVVLHAAAHKHVPLMEVNAGEAVKNNVLGTLTVAEMAGEFGAETFIMISTDKAVNPTSIMGTTKRVAELVVQMLDRRLPTHYVAVRFGNVLGSTGSVIPRFREQIARGGPVTVTHPEMRRYFMTIPEAAQLVLQAGALGKGGEIFILDMGEPVKIVDLAADMITLSGFKPYEEIDIVFTGIRPGEKLFEELGTSADKVEKTRHEKVFVGRIPEIDPEKVAAAISRLVDLCQGANEKVLRQELVALVPEAQLEGIKEAVSGERKSLQRKTSSGTNIVPISRSR